MSSRSAGGSARPLRSHDYSKVALFCRSYPFKPYAYYGISARRLTAYFLAELGTSIRQKTAHGYFQAGQLRGVLILESLPWDSRIFGLRMAQVKFLIPDEQAEAARAVFAGLFGAMEAGCRRLRFDHLTCRVNTRQVALVHFMEERGFRLMDTITQLSIRPSEKAWIPAGTWQKDIQIGKMQAGDLRPLARLSKEVFSNPQEIATRFNSDPHLAQKAGMLYAQWLVNSYRQEQADAVFVAKAKHRPIGFITCRLSDSLAQRKLGVKLGFIPLNAVDKRFRGRGVYTRLVQQAIAWMRERRVSIVEIKTQLHTLGVHTVWRRLGGQLVNTYYVLHQWRRPVS